MKQLLVLFALLPGLAQAAPFDLAELRAEWPGMPYVVLEQGHDIDVVDGVLRIRSERRIAVLTDAAREELSLFEITHRPGCFEAAEVDLLTVGRNGKEQRTTREDLARSPRIQGSDPDAVPTLMKGPRKGIAPGALLTEVVRVDHPPGCFGGLTSAERRLGDRLGPVLTEWARASCAGTTCHMAVDREAGGALFDEEGAVVYRRENVVPLPPESSFPAEDLPRLFVSSSDDPLVAARHLAPRLAEAKAAASKVLGSYTSAARKEQGSEKDGAAKLGRYLANLPVRGSGPFWEGGFGFTAPVKAGGRMLNPLEWWSVALAALAPAGGVPILLDDRSHLDLPAIGVVTAYDEIGVLVPGRFVVLRGEFLALSEGSATDLAGRNAIVLEDSPRAMRFNATGALNRQRWSGSADLTVGDYLKFELVGELEGSRAASLREGYTSRLTSWKQQEKRYRPTPAERDRTFIGGWVFSRNISVGSLEAASGRLDAVTVSAIFSRSAEVQRGEGVVSMVLPLPFEPELEDVVSLGERHRPLALQPVDVAVDLLVKTPPGHRLAGLPEPERVQDGPIAVELSWEEDPAGARLHLAWTVDDAVLDPSLGAPVHRAAELMRRAVNAYVLFVKDE